MCGVRCAVPHCPQPLRWPCHEVAVPAQQLLVLVEMRCQGGREKKPPQPPPASLPSGYLPAGPGWRGCFCPSVCPSLFPLSHPCCSPGAGIPTKSPPAPSNDGFLGLAALREGVLPLHPSPCWGCGVFGCIWGCTTIGVVQHLQVPAPGLPSPTPSADRDAEEGHLRIPGPATFLHAPLPKTSCGRQPLAFPGLPWVFPHGPYTPPLLPWMPQHPAPQQGVGRAQLLPHHHPAQPGAARGSTVLQPSFAPREGRGVRWGASPPAWVPC